MRYGVLGPLQLRTDAGDDVRPRGARQRLLLGLLLLHAPRAVSPDRLADALWGEEPPDDPGAALRNQVSRLRALLRRGDAGEALFHDASGYRLAVGGDAVDAWRLADLQRRAAETADPAAALRLLDEAAALQRGEPYEELRDHRAFGAEIVRLGELLATLQERRGETLLALGRGREALAAVEPLVQEDPLRERPRALCMRALHQEGRRHEALAAFQDYRRLLSSELGLDPSPALRALEAEILQGAVHGPRYGAAAPPDGTSPPPSGAAAQTADTLPAPLTRLIGRGQEIASVCRLLASTRMLTLTGPGGSGKTRFALEVARTEAEQAAREVVWVGLEATADPALVAQEVGAALGVREHPGRAAPEALRKAVAERALLLVLDNCEHLVAACADLVSELLRAGPGVAVLATSREPLGLPGETTWPVPPLTVPDGADLSAGELAGYHAVELFVERARAALPGFALDDGNAPAVARICRQLDGIPLALELAAARVRILSPAEMAGRLESDFDLLSTSRSTLPRHQTLRATLDWSYLLLQEAERRLLGRLAVFAGGFSLAAVEAVCADGGEHGRGNLLAPLSALVEKSLVVVQRSGGETRYRLLETVRAYAGERLAEGPGGEGDVDALRRRHAGWCADLAERAEPDLVSSRRAAVGRRLAADHENLRAALAWSLATCGQQTVLAYRIAGSLWWFWHYLGRFAEARRWSEAALAADGSGVDDALRTRVRYTAAMACWLLGDPVAATGHGAESIRLARRLDEPELLVRAISAHAFALRDVGEVEAAKVLAGECVEVARRAGFPPAEMGFALWIQCTALLNAGDVAPAEEAAQEAEALWRSTGDRWGLSMVLHGLAMARLGVGELDRAAAYFREAVDLLRDDGEPYFITRSIEGLAITLAQQGDADAASRLFGAAEAIRETIGAPLLAFEEERHRKTVEGLAPMLELQQRIAAWEAGRAMSLEEVVAYVRSGGSPPGDLPGATGGTAATRP